MLQFIQSPMKGGRRPLVWGKPCVEHGQLTETTPWYNLQKPLMGVTSCTTYRSWEQPHNDPGERITSEAWGGTGFMLPQLPAPWNPIYSSETQANLTTCITFLITPKLESLDSSQIYLVPLSTFYLTCLISSMGEWKPLESKACVTLNNSHLLSAYYVPATWQTLPNSHKSPTE